MKKTVAVLIFVVLLLIPVFSVQADSVSDIKLPLEKGDAGVGTVIVQRRMWQLGYLHFPPTGKYGDMTVTAVTAFQKRNSLPATGKTNYDTVLTMFSEGAVRAGRSGVINTIFGKGQIAVVKQGDMHDWVKTVDAAFPVGMTVTVTDYNTGTEFDVKRTGGKNHADVTPLKKDELTAVFGGGATWEKRACIITIGDMRIAASLFGSPNKNGEYCMYFSGSASDISGLGDAEHESMILKANGQ